MNHKIFRFSVLVVVFSVLLISAVPVVFARVAKIVPCSVVTRGTKNSIVSKCSPKKVVTVHGGTSVHVIVPQATPAHVITTKEIVVPIVKKTENELPIAPNVIVSTDARIIGYKITSTMFDSTLQKVIPTPQPIIDKISKAFELWSSDKDAKLGFRYDGLAEDHYNGIVDIPSDGRIYIVLNAGNQSIDPGAAGEGGYTGTIPGNYQKGYVFLETNKGLYTLKLQNIIHEIGHTLGLQHVPSNSSIMFCGTPSWSDREVLAFSELDRAYLTKIWSPNAGSLVYNISGTVGNATNEFVPVFAVNTVNGHTYSTLANATGVYSIPILVPGQYRVFSKAYEMSAFGTPVTKSPSWYVLGQISSNDPYAGTIILVDGSHRNTSNINFRLIQQSVPFNLFWTNDRNGSTGPYTFNQAFLKKGASGDVELGFTNGATIKSVEAYGSVPDYTISDLHDHVTQGGTYPTFKVGANANAEYGDRLVIAKGASGSTEAGLIGIDIIGSQDPNYISNMVMGPNFSFGESGWVENQIQQNFNFRWLDANYWKN